MDLISGIAVSNLGHSHPEIKKAVKKQVDRHLHLMVYGEVIQSVQVELAKELCSLLPSQLSSVYFTNSGSEATEGAIKLAKRFTGRNKIISFRNSYHGSTQGSLSVCGNEALKNSYRPLLPGIKILEFNSVAELGEIDEKTAAVIIEPIQAEAGLIIPEETYLKKLKEECEANGTLLILDEIQTGMHRTGPMFAFEESGVIPDILLLGKAFGGGLPLGAFISSRKIMSVLSYDPVLGHITTFGGHPLSCAASLALVKHLKQGNYKSEVIRKGRVFQNYLHHPLIREFRGKGLFCALKFDSSDLNQKVIGKCLERGLLTDWFLFAPDCLRIAPPLIISDDEIKMACSVILESLNEN